VKRAFLSVLAVVVVAGGAFGHPHVFIDTRIEVACDEAGLTGFWIDWRFDRVFTASILLDFDKDKNGILGTVEVQAVRAGAFANLANYKYFVYIRAAKRLHRPAGVSDFSAYLQEQRLHYRFFVPFQLALGPEELEINVAVYDETFYCAIGYVEPDPVLLPACAWLQGSYAIREDRGIRIEYPDNMGTRASTFPRQAVLRLRRQP